MIMTATRILSLALFTSMIALSAPASIVDRTPLADPRSELVDIGPGAVVASESASMFLLHGQRITTEGVNLDGEQIPGTEGRAVGWTDGWLIIDETIDYLEISRLMTDGTVTPFAKIPRRGELLSFASNDGRLAILEREDGNPTRVWLTVLDESGIIKRAPLARLHTGAITAFGSGFMAVTSVRTQVTEIVHAWLIDREGIPQEFETIGEVPLYSVPPDRELSPLLTVSKPGDRVLFRTSRSLYIIDGDLSVTGPITFSPWGNIDRTALAIDGGFLVTYGYWTSAFGTLWRGRVITADGTVRDQQEIDPIVAGDRIGDTYLVLRPWGHAGLAQGDPRTIVEALRMKVRLHQPPELRDTVVTGEVTLTDITYRQSRTDQQPGGRYFVRFDADGTVLDDDLVPFPGNVVAAIPQGFAFLDLQQNAITMRRLDARGGWIDDEPMVLTSVAEETRVIAAESNGQNLVVAWATEDEIVWSVYGLDGSPLRGEPYRMARTNELQNSGLVLNGRENGERLLMLEDTDLPCELSPCSFEFRHWSVGIDSKGDPIGSVNQLPAEVGLRAAGLPDGTWAIPGYFDVHQLSRSGVLLQETPSPFDEPHDLRATATGWEAIVPHPMRLVEVSGLADLIRVTSLEGVETAHFGSRGAASRSSMMRPLRSGEGCHGTAGSKRFRAISRCASFARGQTSTVNTSGSMCATRARVLPRGCGCMLRS